MHANDQSNSGFKCGHRFERPYPEGISNTDNNPDQALVRMGSDTCSHGFQISPASEIEMFCFILVR